VLLGALFNAAALSAAQAADSAPLCETPGVCTLPGYVSPGVNLVGWLWSFWRR